MNFLRSKLFDDCTVTTKIEQTRNKNLSTKIKFVLFTQTYFEAVHNVFSL